MASPAENTPKTQSSTLGENAASYGKFRNKLSAILLGIVGFLFLVSSLYFLSHANRAHSLYIFFLNKIMGNIDL